VSNGLPLVGKPSSTPCTLHRRAVRTEYRRRQNATVSPRLPGRHRPEPRSSPFESLVEPSTPPRVEALCGDETSMAAVTSASNAPAPTPAQLSQLPENTSSSLHYVEDTAASPDESSYFRPVEDVLDFDGQSSSDGGHRRQKRRSRYLAQLSRRRANHGDSFVRCRRRPPSTAVPRNTASAQTVDQMPLAATLTPSFLTGQSATASSTTTARPSPR